jgi:excisionase family DNA binding protein
MTNNEQPTREYVTVDQAAEYLKVHPETIRRLLRDHTLRGKKTLMNRWRVEIASLVEVAANYHPEQ